MENTSKKPVGVTKDLIEAFLAAAESSGIPTETISALRMTLVEEGKCSENSLVAAIFSEEQS